MRASDFKKLLLVASSSSLNGISRMAEEYLLSPVDLSPAGDEFRIVKQEKDFGLVIKRIGNRWQMRSE